MAGFVRYGPFSECKLLTIRFLFASVEIAFKFIASVFFRMLDWLNLCLSVCYLILPFREESSSYELICSTFGSLSYVTL